MILITANNNLTQNINSHLIIPPYGLRLIYSIEMGIYLITKCACTCECNVLVVYRTRSLSISHSQIFISHSQCTREFGTRTRKKDNSHSRTRVNLHAVGTVALHPTL